MTKENIIIAALRLFLQRGYESVSLVDVAREAGITKGGIYHYFSSKDELLQVALNYFLDSFETRYQALLNGADSLQEVLRLLFVENVMEVYGRNMLGGDQACHIDHIHFTIDIMRRFPVIQQRIHQYQITLQELLAAKIEQAAASGEIRQDVDCHALAAIIAACMNGRKSLGKGLQQESMGQPVADAFWKMISC